MAKTKKQALAELLNIKVYDIWGRNDGTQFLTPCGYYYVLREDEIIPEMISYLSGYEDDELERIWGIKELTEEEVSQLDPETVLARTGRSEQVVEYTIFPF